MPSRYIHKNIRIRMKIPSIPSTPVSPPRSPPTTTISHHHPPAMHLAQRTYTHTHTARRQLAYSPLGAKWVTFSFVSWLRSRRRPAHSSHPLRPRRESLDRDMIYGAPRADRYNRLARVAADWFYRAGASERSRRDSRRDAAGVEIFW